MKKVIFVMALFLCVNAISFAQDKKAKASTPTAKPATVSATAPSAKSASVSGKTKADGTPDMRYKENKDKAAAETASTTNHRLINFISLSNSQANL